MSQGPILTPSGKARPSIATSTGRASMSIGRDDAVSQRFREIDEALTRLGVDDLRKRFGE